MSQKKTLVTIKVLDIVIVTLGVQFSLATIHDYEMQHKRNYYMAREPRRNHEAYRTWTPLYLEEYKTERAYME